MDLAEGDRLVSIATLSDPGEIAEEDESGSPDDAGPVPEI
jgi:hypothetical protein